MAEGKMIDWDRVSELREEVGKEDFAEVVDLFLEEVEEVVARLSHSPDPATYEEDLHFLKGSALNLGFNDLGDICQAGEKAASEGQAQDIDISKVIAVYTQSKAEFLSRGAEFGIAA